jgi:hypothetical protein
MPTITTQTKNVFVDKIITNGGLNIKYKLYVNLTHKPVMCDDDEEDVEDESHRFQYMNRAVLEGAYGNKLSLYVNGQSVEIDTVEELMNVKKSIQSFLKTKKYNKIIKQNTSDKTGLTVKLTVEEGYDYFEALKKTDLKSVLELLNAYCPAK